MNDTLTAPGPLLTEAELRAAPSEDYMSARQLAFFRARLIAGRDDMPAVESFGKQDSSMMRIFSQSDCLIIRPPNAPAVEAGDTVPVFLLRP